jgi:hypothetical protein
MVLRACKSVSAYAQHTHAIIFKKLLKNPRLKCKSTVKNPNFEKPIRNPSNRTQMNILNILLMLSNRENV